MTSSSRRAGFVRCDANISVKQHTTTCAFANNAFYEYWKNDGAERIRAYSSAAHRVFSTRCSTRADQVECVTTDGGVVRFSHAAIDRYSQSQADSYAASHDLGPASASVGGGAPSSDGGALSSPPSASPDPSVSPPPTPSSSADFCDTHDCIPNYPNGNGSTVQCADGTYSQSGGIQGACSHHGGVR